MESALNEVCVTLCKSAFLIYWSCTNCTKNTDFFLLEKTQHCVYYTNKSSYEKSLFKRQNLPGIPNKCHLEKALHEAEKHVIIKEEECRLKQTLQK